MHLRCVKRGCLPVHYTLNVENRGIHHGKASFWFSSPQAGRPSCRERPDIAITSACAFHHRPDGSERMPLIVQAAKGKNFFV